ncbi:hypothetical protein NDU88_001986 [Pleurodeles waltl]|uniref:Uncharacterized protein n=1 Tax=Pleurodeles waltl TaxID=8319 RepID=A0AAV7RA29_PLEWA|nr:hypothetical protein NDU88_001986 [Pleurodeles waltl]
MAGDGASCARHLEVLHDVVIEDRWTRKRPGASGTCVQREAAFQQPVRVPGPRGAGRHRFAPSSNLAHNHVPPQRPEIKGWGNGFGVRRAPLSSLAVCTAGDGPAPSPCEAAGGRGGSAGGRVRLKLPHSALPTHSDLTAR